MFASGDSGSCTVRPGALQCLAVAASRDLRHDRGAAGIARQLTSLFPHAMSDRFELVAIALPSGCAPEALLPAVAALLAACWPGMSRAQLLDRARRLALRISLRARPEAGPDGVRLYSLVLEDGEVRTELVAHVRRLVRRRTTRRAKASLPPLRDVRQQELFS